MTRVAVLGFGSIGKYLADGWTSAENKTELVGLCVRPHQAGLAKAMAPPGTSIVTDIAALIGLGPDIIVECAGQETARQCAMPILTAGKELFLLSVGILADQNLNDMLRKACMDSGASIGIPAGALAGFDGLLAKVRDGLKSVRYVSTKPPQAWYGTPAEALHPLASLTAPTVIFQGNARDAAQRFPKNANLAAAVALAGLGFERTQVELVADPGLDGNAALLEARGPDSHMIVNISGAAARSNPKTSVIVGASVFSALANRQSPIRFV